MPIQHLEPPQARSEILRGDALEALRPSAQSADIGIDVLNMPVVSHAVASVALPTVHRMVSGGSEGLDINSFQRSFILHQSSLASCTKYLPDPLSRAPAACDSLRLKTLKHPVGPSVRVVQRLTFLVQPAQRCLQHPLRHGHAGQVHRRVGLHLPENPTPV